MKRLKQGILISIEGIDGSGKSTLAKRLYNSLSKDFATTLTKEPGGTILGKTLRTILQEQKEPVCDKAEFLLFAADRAQHFEEVIIPCLHKKNIVISDRMADSSIVYQGFGRGLSIDIIKQINAWAMNDFAPDITFYINVPLNVALKRLEKRAQLSAFEQEKTNFVKKLIHGFDTIFEHNKNAYTLDGTQSPDVLEKQTVEIVNKWIKTENLLQ